MAHRPRSLMRRAAAATLLAVGIGVIAGASDAVAASPSTASAAHAVGAHHKLSPNDWWW